MMPWRLLSSANAYIFGWLVGYSTLLGPVAGIMITDYFLLRRRELDSAGLYCRTGPYAYWKGVDWRAVLSLAAGVLCTAVGLAIPPLRWLYDYGWSIGFGVSGSIYYVSMRRGFRLLSHSGAWRREHTRYSAVFAPERQMQHREDQRYSFMNILGPPRRFALGIGLVGGLAALLFYADRNQRNWTGGSTTAPAGTYRIGIAYFAPEEGNDLCMRGLIDGLREQGFVEGHNLVILRAHAQAEISNIPAMLQNFDSQGLDLIIPMTTPCLTAACTMVRKTPVTFVYVYDPVAAGAGKSLTDHLPNVTGVGSFPDLAETFDVIRQLVPNVSSIGTLYNSSEANSRKAVSVGRELCEKRGLHLQEVAVTSTSEVFQAAQVLATRDIQALWVSGDNTALQAFPGIAKVAADHRLPLIINDPEFVQKGALAAVGIGWYRSGFEAGRMASRVLRGERTSSIPMLNVVEKKLVLNPAVARTLGITLPGDLRARAGL